MPSLFESIAYSILLLDPDTIGVIPARHVGQNDGVAFAQAFDDLDRIHRGSPNLYWHAQGSLPARAEFEQADGAVLLPERRPAYIEHVVHPLQVDGSIHAQFRPRALGKFPGEFYVDRHRSVLYSRIDTHHCAGNQTVVSINRRKLTNLHVARLGLSDLQSSHQMLGL